MAVSNNSFNVKNGLTVNTSLLFANNGRVGINTDSPDTTLTVAGTANVQGNVAVTGTLSTTANVITVNVYATTITSNVVSLVLTSNTIGANVVTANSITAAANTIFNANVYIASNSYLYVPGNLVVNDINTDSPNTTLTVAAAANVQGNVAVTGTLSTTANVITVNVYATTITSNVVSLTLTSNSINANVVTANSITAAANVITVNVYATTITSNVVSLTLTSNSINANVVTANSITAAANTIFNANVYIASNSYLFVSGNLVVNGTLTTVNAVSANGNSIPATNATFSLGNSTFTWSSLFVSSNLNIGSISATSNGFVANTTAITVGNSTVNAVITSTSQSFGYIGSLPGFTANTTVITLGNSSVNATVNSTAFSGSATSLVGYTFATPSPIGSGTANSGNFSSLTIAGSAVATESYVSSTIPTVTANNATYLGGVIAAGYVQNTESRTLSGNLTFSSAVTSFTGANVTLSSTTKIIANSAFGTTGQVLSSNGTGVYWASAVGPIGYTGSAGSTGAQGGIGYTGSQGVIGYTGSKGDAGTNGSTGSIGAQGVIGYTGSQGVIGYTGSKGDAGTNGSTGAQGVIGYTGSQGVIGYTGSKGDIGYTGSAGGFTTNSNAQVNSLGVGTAASASAGDIRATGDITAYYSDDRLKTKLGDIQNALEKLLTLSGFYYEANEVAQALGYTVKREVGVSAQEVQDVLPEVVAAAPISDEYLTVKYERIIPLIIEAIKELNDKVESSKCSCCK